MPAKSLVCSLASGGVSANSPLLKGEFATSPLERLRILEHYSNIAMVGLSSNPYRPSHFAAKYLLFEGYNVIPVNPREKQILGKACYPSVTNIPGPVEVVDIFRPARDVPPIVCAGSAGTGERALRVSVDAALRAGIFKASGSFDPMGFWDERER